MVGVGGRSKACDHCRRRRVKCDLTLPACHRCIKAKLTCGGSRGMSVIQYEGKNSRSNVSQPRQENGDLVSLRWKRVTPRKPQTQSLLGMTLEIPREEIIVRYADAHLAFPNDKSVLEPAMSTGLTRQTFLAMATTFFGTEQKDGSLVQQGLRGYGRAISRLNEALGDPKQYPTFDLLQSVVIMAMFEYLVSDQEYGWINHARGLERLMELRGPETFTSLPELVILERNRPANIFAAMITQQPTILARPEWQTIPWSQYPERKTHLQLLYDLCAYCPGLLATKYHIEAQSIGESTHIAYRSLATRVQKLMEELEQLRTAWTNEHPNCQWEAPSPITTPAIIGPTGRSIPKWSTVLHYQSLYHANFATASSAMHIFFLQLCQDTSMSELMTPEETKNISSKIYSSGISICQGIDYYVDEIRKGAFSYLLIFPLKMALESVGKSDPAIGLWLKGILDQITSGLSGKWAMKPSASEVRREPSILEVSHARSNLRRTIGE